MLYRCYRQPSSRLQNILHFQYSGGLFYPLLYSFLQLFQEAYLVLSLTGFALCFLFSIAIHLKHPSIRGYPYRCPHYDSYSPETIFLQMLNISLLMRQYQVVYPLPFRLCGLLRNFQGSDAYRWCSALLFLSALPSLYSRSPHAIRFFLRLKAHHTRRVYHHLSVPALLSFDRYGLKTPRPFETPIVILCSALFLHAGTVQSRGQTILLGSASTYPLQRQRLSLRQVRGFLARSYAQYARFREQTY